MNKEITQEMVGFALTNTLLSLYDICNVKKEDEEAFDKLQHLIGWYQDCLEKGLGFSFELVARMGWASRHSIELFKDEFSSQECRLQLQKWATNDKKMQALLKKLDLNPISQDS